MKYEISILSRTFTYIKSYNSDIAPMVGDDITIQEDNTTNTYTIVKRILPSESENNKMVIIINKE